MTTLAQLAARHAGAALTAAWEAFLADVPMSWVRDERAREDK